VEEGGYVFSRHARCHPTAGGEESVPIHLAQCRFPGLSIFSAKILTRIFEMKHTEAILSKTLGNCYGLKLSKCCLWFKRKKPIVSFIIIFGALSFRNVQSDLATYSFAAAWPTVTFPAARHHRPLTGTKLYCLMTQAHVCKHLVPEIFT